MDIGQQILPGTSPPTSNNNQNYLNQLPIVINSNTNNTNNNTNINSNTSNNNSLNTSNTQEPIKRIYSSKSKTIHTESHHNGHSNQLVPKSNQTIVMNSGGVFPIMNKPNYFFPPFPSPNACNGNAFIIPPFPSHPVNSSSLSNTLSNVNQQVDMLNSSCGNQSGYSSSSSSPNSAHIPQIDLEKSNIDSVPIKKRQKKSNCTTDHHSTPLDISNQIVTTDEENTYASPSNTEKKRQRKDSNDTPTDRQKEKKERRLIRNRQSAQASRERKKLYIQTLEEKVSNLEQRVKLLEEENSLLRRQVI